MKSKICGRLIFIALLSLILNACTTSTVVKSHASFAKASDSKYATVYLIRPTPIRTRGIADNDLSIEFGEKQLVSKLSAGEYIAVKIIPDKLDIIIRSITYITSNPLPEEVWRSENFTFEAGKNYFIHTRFTQEEFRGIYFVPEEISLQTAKSYLKRLKPANNIAKKHPLTSL